MGSENRTFLSYAYLLLRSVFHLAVGSNIGAVLYGVKDDVTDLVQKYDVIDILDSVDVYNLEPHWYPLAVSAVNILFQTTFLFLALSHDALEWVDKHENRVGRLIKYWRDVVFSGLVVPITCFVTAMFWSIYSIDRELVFPMVYDQIVPWWFNHCVHTNIFIIICVETLLQARRRPVDVRMENVCVITTIVAYAVVYYSIYFFGHRWLYQVFAIMTWWQVCLFQCVIWGSSYCFYLVQYPINRLIHGSEDTENEKAEISDEKGNIPSCSDMSLEGGSKGDLNVKEDDNGTQVGNGVNGNGFKIGSLEKNGSLKGDLKKPPFADRSWSLKYRTIRDQFEKTSL